MKELVDYFLTGRGEKLTEEQIMIAECAVIRAMEDNLPEGARTQEVYEYILGDTVKLIREMGIIDLGTKRSESTTE